MRLLFLSNFFPPAGRGGYEGWCQEVAEGLRGRGHDVTVLTSRHGLGNLPAVDPPWVHRRLHLEMELASLRNALTFFIRRKRRERENLAVLQGMIDALAPDAVLLWGMWNLPRSLPALIEQRLPTRTAYYFGDYWPTLPDQFSRYWEAPAQSWAAAVPKAVLGAVARRLLAAEPRPALALRQGMFPSAFLQQKYAEAGLIPERSAVVLGGVETHRYREAPAATGRFNGLTLLYAGRLTREKGALTAVEALAQLVARAPDRALRLLIAGEGDADYERQLRAEVDRRGLASRVEFLGPRTGAEMPPLYREADLFLFTSLWEEPFGRVIVEAMASGLAVVGTATGGAAEILQDGVNGLVYPPGDAAALADRLQLLAEKPARRAELAAAGRETAGRFDCARMIGGVENFLEAMMA